MLAISYIYFRGYCRQQTSASLVERNFGYYKNDLGSKHPTSIVGVYFMRCPILSNSAAGFTATLSVSGRL